jgi:uncharacterized protein YunC (DUF1805 family)
MTASDGFLVADSITEVGPEARGRTVLAASHGGAYAGHVAAELGLSAVILNDAGVGLDRAGIASLANLQQVGIAAATAGNRTARIGDGPDCLQRGRISYANERAAQLGVVSGMPVREALERLDARRTRITLTAGHHDEARRMVLPPDDNRPAVWILDSVSLVADEDRSAIIVTGSHGGLLAGRPEVAIKKPVLGAIFNDADRGMDDAGITRLAALDRHGIPCAAVSAWSARIGDGASTYEQGVISAVNATAASLGAAIGIRTKDLVPLLRDAIKGKTVR